MKLANFDFRIWDKGEETLTYAGKDWKLSIGFSNPQQDNGETESVLHAYYDGEPQCPDDCEIELWSGFYDKNGKKIYEGDILEFRGELFIVKLAKGLSLSVISLTYAMHTSKSNFRACRVLGNIHENAELLGKDKE